MKQDNHHLFPLKPWLLRPPPASSFPLPAASAGSAAAAFGAAFGAAAPGLLGGNVFLGIEVTD